MRPSRCGRRSAKSNLADVQPVHKCVDHPNRRIRSNIVLNRSRQQRRLPTIRALNIARAKGRTVVDAALLI
jgi:hypothetical protein